MRLIPDVHLRHRAPVPHPGLINLPVPLPSIPVISPLLSPLVGGADQPTHTPAPAPAPAPPPSPAPAPRPPPPPPPSPSPPASGSSGSSGGSGGGSHPPSSGTGSSSGNGGGSPAPSSGNAGGNNSLNGSSGGDGVHGGGASAGSSSQGNSNSNSPASSSPSTPPSSPASGTSPDTEGSLVVSGSSTFRVTSTGVVPIPVNNAAADPASDDTSTDGTAVSASGQSSGATNVSGVPVTPAGSQGASGSSHATVGGAGAKTNGGNSGNTDSTDGNSAASSGSHGHLSSGAIGGIVAIVVIVCLVLGGIVIRNRYKRRKNERHVQWISGYVSDGSGGQGDPEMLQRSNSKRSTWGTPVETRISTAFRRSLTPSPTEFDEAALYAPSSPHGYERSESGAPVLPMPVHSPSQTRFLGPSPEDPFADAIAPPQPLQPLSSLPLRISLISSESGGHDPFDDIHQYVVNDHDHEPIPDTPISSATFGRRSGWGSHAHFPMPPPTASSTTTTTAFNTLQAPGILISFPDSPISPTFAASGTSSYPRRASVKHMFQPSQERRDEVHVDEGDQVSVVSVYEDGWAFVQRERDNERGLVPLTVLEMNKP